MTAISPYTVHRYNLAREGVMLEVSSHVSTKPWRGQPDLSDSEVRKKVLNGFLKVVKPSQLVLFSRQYGIPTRSQELFVVSRTPRFAIQQEGAVDETIYRVSEFLELAGMFRWLQYVLLTIIQDQREQQDELISWIKGTESMQGGLFVPTETFMRLEFEVPRESTKFDDWKSSQIFLPKVMFEARLAKWNRDKKSQQFLFARTYLSSAITWLIRNTGLGVDPQGKYFFKIPEPYDAMGFAMYEQFTGASGIDACRNPDCKRFFVVARPDNIYCSDSCARSGCRKIGRVRQKRKEE